MTMLIAHDGGCVVVRLAGRLDQFQRGLCWAVPVTRVTTAA
jgi:hypothetical protein